MAYNKNKQHKTLDYWLKDMLNFEFLERCLRLVSPPHFVCNFSRKIVLMLYFITWPIFSVWLPGCDVLKFVINLIFLIKPFFSMTKRSRSWEEKEFLRCKKILFYHFQSIFCCQKLFLTWECVKKGTREWLYISIALKKFEIISW